MSSANSSGVFTRLEEAPDVQPFTYLAPPRGVLLDIDGTLLDSNGAHARAWIEALMGEGIALPYAMVRRQIGKGGEKLLWELLKVKQDSVLAETISRHRRAIFKARYLPDLRAFSRTRDLLLRMRASGMTLHVATSSTAEEVNDLLTAAGVPDLVEHIAAKGDAMSWRPEADLVLAAVARTGLPGSELVMLGDTPYDVESARNAGVRIVALGSGGWVQGELAGADAYYSDASDLLARWDTSPFGATVRVPCETAAASAR